MKRWTHALSIWALASLGCAALVACLFLRVDVPAAHYFWRPGRFLSPLGAAFGSVLILSGELAVMMGILIVRALRGQVPPFAATLATACFASIGSYCANDLVLKELCGVPGVAYVMSGARHHFHLWAGSTVSSFPSGHMVLASAFAGVFFQRYRQSVWPLSLLLVVAAVLLVVGDWHFLSDVVAGAYLGISAGILVGLVRRTMME